MIQKFDTAGAGQSKGLSTQTIVIGLLILGVGSYLLYNHYQKKKALQVNQNKGE